MLLSPRRSLLVHKNSDSGEEPTLPSKLLLNLPDEVVPSSRGIPLHTRYTRRNQIQVGTFRKLVYVEVLTKLHIMLNPDVMNVIELYTFERTHPVVPHKRTEQPRSLIRDGDILDLLTPCEQYANLSNCEEDYVMHTLIGRVLYGFDIYDSRYSTIDDPNPCEIMTNEGGIYLVPDQMSDWFLYKDGECVALPVLQRFKHCITDARLLARSSGPFLRLVLKPIQSLIPGKDSMLHGTTLGSGINCEDSDLESFVSSDIDPNLMNITKSTTEDSLAVEIANCWNSTRESVLVVVSPPTMFEESCDNAQSVFSAVLTDDSDSDSPEKVAGILDCEDEYKEESGKEDKDSDDDSSCGEPTGEFPLNKPEHKGASEVFVSSSTTPHRSSITSLGSTDLHSIASGDESESDDDNTHFGFISRRPSLNRETDPQAPIIIELGAGVIGFPDISMSYLHTMTTPNPYSHCCHCRDSSLESMEL